MALVLPNIDQVQKGAPKLGELLKKIQDYTNQNVTPTPGNRVPPPPFNPGRTTV